jgi:hypothetical protein
MKEVGKLYVHLVYFTAVWFILWPLSIFYVWLVIWYILRPFGIFFPFGMLYLEKSGNPGFDRLQKIKCYLTSSAFRRNAFLVCT